MASSAATIDRSCPNGCFDLEVSGHHDARDDREFLNDRALADDFESCPYCDAPLTDGDSHE